MGMGNGLAQARVKPPNIHNYFAIMHAVVLVQT
jgi:hypothetical protein